MNANLRTDVFCAQAPGNVATNPNLTKDSVYLLCNTVVQYLLCNIVVQYLLCCACCDLTVIALTHRLDSDSDRFATYLLPVINDG